MSRKTALSIISAVESLLESDRLIDYGSVLGSEPPKEVVDAIESAVRESLDYLANTLWGNGGGVSETGFTDLQIQTIKNLILDAGPLSPSPQQPGLSGPQYQQQTKPLIEITLPGQTRPLQAPQQPQMVPISGEVPVDSPVVDYSAAPQVPDLPPLQQNTTPYSFGPPRVMGRPKTKRISPVAAALGLDLENMSAADRAAAIKAAEKQTKQS